MLAYPFYLVILPRLTLTTPPGLYYIRSNKFMFHIRIFLLLMQWSRSPGKKGSHFEPDSDLFLPKEKKDVLTSTACWTAMAALLVCLNFVMGPIQMLKLYGIPYWVTVLVIPLFSPTWWRYLLGLQSQFKCRYLLCGWTSWLTCTTMAMKTSSLGTVARYAESTSPFSDSATAVMRISRLVWNFPKHRNGVTWEEGSQHWIGTMDGSTTSTTTLELMWYIIFSRRSHTIIL